MKTIDDNNPVVKLIRDTVRQQAPDAEIILYGSRARGDARPGSDWDVIILRNKPHLTPTERGIVDYNLWKKGLDINEEINTFEYTRSEWDNMHPSLFKHNVTQDGIRL